MGLLAAEGGRPGLNLGQTLAQIGGALLGIQQRLLLLLQLGQQAGLVIPAAALPGPQPLVGLGPGHVLLPGGHQGGNALLQFLALGDGQVGLPQEDRPVKDLPADPGEGLPHVLGGEARRGQAGGPVDGGEVPHGDAPGGGPADLQRSVPLLADHEALHGDAAPGAVTVLIGRGSLSVPLAGVQAVEHGPQEGAPGGLARPVGGADEGKAPVEGQGLVFQTAKGGRELQEFHRGSSLPSRAARPKRTARSRPGFSSSEASSRRFRMVRRKSPVRVSSPARSHRVRLREVPS